MSRIIRAVNSMISQKEKISNVLKRQSECFFLFDKKYKWSILHRSDTDSYILYYYSGDISLEVLASMDDFEWDNFKDYVMYSSSEIKTIEAHDTFAELYLIVKEIAHGVDKVLDDIIGSEF